MIQCNRCRKLKSTRTKAIRMMRTDGISVADIAKVLNLSRMAIYNILAKKENAES